MLYNKRSTIKSSKDQAQQNSYQEDYPLKFKIYRKIWEEMQYQNWKERKFPSSPTIIYANVKDCTSFRTLDKPNFFCNWCWWVMIHQGRLFRQAPSLLEMLFKKKSEGGWTLFSNLSSLYEKPKTYPLNDF